MIAFLYLGGLLRQLLKFSRKSPARCRLAPEMQSRDGRSAASDGNPIRRSSRFDAFPLSNDMRIGPKHVSTSTSDACSLRPWATSRQSLWPSLLLPPYLYFLRRLPCYLFPHSSGGHGISWVRAPVCVFETGRDQRAWISLCVHTGGTYFPCVMAPLLPSRG